MKRAFGIILFMTLATVCSADIVDKIFKANDRDTTTIVGYEVFMLGDERSKILKLCSENNYKTRVVGDSIEIVKNNNTSVFLNFYQKKLYTISILISGSEEALEYIIPKYLTEKYGIPNRSRKESWGVQPYWYFNKNRYYITAYWIGKIYCIQYIDSVIQDKIINSNTKERYGDF